MTRTWFFYPLVKQRGLCSLYTLFLCASTERCLPYYLITSIVLYMQLEPAYIFKTHYPLVEIVLKFLHIEPPHLVITSLTFVIVITPAVGSNHRHWGRSIYWSNILPVSSFRWWCCKICLPYWKGAWLRVQMYHKQTMWKFWDHRYVMHMWWLPLNIVFRLYSTLLIYIHKGNW